MSTPVKKIPQWKLDMLRDAEVAAAVTVKAEEAAIKAKLDAEVKAKVDADRARLRADWHAWKAANPYITKQVGVTSGAPMPGERGWLVEPKAIYQRVPNTEVCPY
jgi:hypothetical protein